jgi:hypothetical protein
MKWIDPQLRIIRVLQSGGAIICYRRVYCRNVQSRSSYFHPRLALRKMTNQDLSMGFKLKSDTTQRTPFCPWARKMRGFRQKTAIFLSDEKSVKAELRERSMVVSYFQEMRTAKLTCISFARCLRWSLNALIWSKSAHSSVLCEYFSLVVSLFATGQHIAAVCNPGRHTFAPDLPCAKWPPRAFP